MSDLSHFELSTQRLRATDAKKQIRKRTHTHNSMYCIHITHYTSIHTDIHTLGMNKEWKPVKNVELHVGIKKRLSYLHVILMPLFSLHKAMIKGKCVLSFLWRICACAHWNGTSTVSTAVAILLLLNAEKKTPDKIQVGFSFSFVIGCYGLLYPWYMYAHFVGSFSHSRSGIVAAFSLCKITAIFFGALRVFISCSTFTSRQFTSYTCRITWIDTKNIHTNYLDTETHK